ncbi:MAG: hypothetical protein M9921_13520 [Fimbriimonadaceae bacterium]|nr:hypothetical protein [Fimbriimonadaceae bacterium]
MLRWIVALAVAVALAGCDATPEMAAPVVKETPPAMVAPDFGTSTRIGLLRKRGKLKVGDSLERALDLFQPPKRAREFSELPSRLTKPYRADGWEANAEGFGVITFEDRVAAAVHTLNQATEDQVTELVNAYQDELRAVPELVAGEVSRYWFWELPRMRPGSAPGSSAADVHQRLMIVAVRNPSGTFVLTEAMGDVFAMNAIRANIYAAKNDVPIADAAATAKAGQAGH